MPPPSLVMQTNYAELLERCTTAAFATSFPQDGSFIKKTVKGRRYWYFQSSTENGRTQKYVGPETPELLAQIEHHKEARDDERERRALVAALVRSFRLPRPKAEIGNAIEALAKAGVFRLRGVLVGTVAYQTYPAMLGITLPNTSLLTDDIDIAQFDDVSVAVDDRTPSIVDILKEADGTFRAAPTMHGGRVTSYVAKDGLRVEFLTPNRGPDTDSPRALPALQTDAQPLRFLDFLIYESEQAVVLHGAGALVLVPSPQRYAVHKLIISRRRGGGNIKRDKDIQQAEALLRILNDKRPYELGEVWNEAFERGHAWQQAITEGMTQIDASVRDLTLKVANKTREILPQIDLTFDDRPPAYDFDREAVIFHGKALGHSVTCRISRAALDDNFEPHHSNNEGRLKKFRENRTTIEAMARVKYLSWPIEEPGIVLIKTLDFERSLRGPFTSRQ
ncbi:MAG: DUF1488 family protein [Rhodopseudomonas sp.]|nr:DUF1488 family protein [Rhodopseudomonas sp.]